MPGVYRPVGHLARRLSRRSLSNRLRHRRRFHHGGQCRPMCFHLHLSTGHARADDSRSDGTYQNVPGEQARWERGRRCCDPAFLLIRGDGGIGEGDPGRSDGHKSAGYHVGQESRGHQSDSTALSGNHRRNQGPVSSGKRSGPSRQLHPPRRRFPAGSIGWSRPAMEVFGAAPTTFWKSQRPQSLRPRRSGRR